MNLPAHGTASPDPSKASVSVKDSTPQYTEHQRFRLAQPTRRQAKLLQTAWRNSPPARRQRAPRPHWFLVTAWRSTPCRQAPAQCNPPTPWLSPGGVQWTARRHTSSFLLLVLAPNVVNYAIPECFRKHCTLVLSELLISNTLPSQV